MEEHCLQCSYSENTCKPCPLQDPPLASGSLVNHVAMIIQVSSEYQIIAFYLETRFEIK